MVIPHKKTFSNGQVCFPLQNDSPAVNAGNNSLVPTNVKHDQIGNPRIIQTTVDIGSIERNPPTAIIDNTTNLSVQEGCWLPVSGSGVDPLGKGLTYFWDLSGNGMFSASSGPAAWFSAEHLNGTVGAFQTIRLKVSDAEGTESEIVETNVSIIDVMPTYYVTVPKADELVAGRLAFWEISAIDVPSDPIVKWVVNWGDGMETVLNGGPRSRVVLNHSYAEAKSYVITVSTIDLNGDVSTITFKTNVKVNIQATQQVLSMESVFESIPVLPENSFDMVSKMNTQVAIVPPRINNEMSGETLDFNLALMETMRQRLILDLDQSGNLGQKADTADFSEWLWADDELFDLEWLGFNEQPEENDFWSEVFKDDLLLDMKI